MYPFETRRDRIFLRFPSKLTTLRLDLIYCNDNTLGSVDYRELSCPHLKHLDVFTRHPRNLEFIDFIVASSRKLTSISLDLDFSDFRYQNFSSYANKPSGYTLGLVKTFRVHDDGPATTTYLEAMIERWPHETHPFRPRRLEFLDRTGKYNDSINLWWILNDRHLSAVVREIKVERLSSTLYGRINRPDRLKKLEIGTLYLTAQFHRNLEDVYSNLSGLEFTVGEVARRPRKARVDDDIENQWFFELNFWEKETGKKLYDMDNEEPLPTYDDEDEAEDDDADHSASEDDFEDHDA